MTTTTLTARPGASSLSFLTGFLSGLRRIQERSAARAKLLRLDDRMLKDIGLTRDDVLSGRF